MSLLVVGAGPAGIAAALQARELGAEVTLLEGDQAGGTVSIAGRRQSASWPEPRS
jgi:NADPH-dependent 2,4-dienoyl-CoA reductase/sulfur reductase-like enzyme